MSHYWSPENGVPQRRWQWLTGVLTAAGHDVAVIAPPPHYPHGSVSPNWQRVRVEQGPAGEKIYRSLFLPYGRSVSLSIKALSQLVGAVSASLWGLKLLANKKTRPDVIIGTVPALPTAITTRLLATVGRVPYVIDLRDAWPDLLDSSSEWNADTGKKSLKERILQHGIFPALSRVVSASLNSTLRHASGVIVTSEWLGRHLRNNVLRGRGENTQVVTVRNVFPASVQNFWKQPNPPEKQFKVLYAGTLGRAQMLTNTIEALRLLKGTDTKVKLRFVGGGAALENLKSRASMEHVDVEFVPRVSTDEMEEHYRWCDSALVHLTGWEPLLRAVPSKTYELMECGVHITGVVDGESAELIKKLGAGHVVSTDDPQALAELWQRLAADRSLIVGDDVAHDWVVEQREQVAPKVLLELIDELTR